MSESLTVLMRLVTQRIRARTWSLRGATVAAKVSVGARSRIDFPSTVSLGARVTLESDVWLKIVDGDATLQIGRQSFLGRGCELDVADRVTIGEKVLIAPRVFITDHSHNIDSPGSIMNLGCSALPVSIGNDVWIGTGAVILPGVTIGDGAVIGANAVVRQDIPAGEIWAGVPARKIRQRANAEM
ncbi:MAG: acyltransferase [Planctomycetota bacterium]